MHDTYRRAWSELQRRPSRTAGVVACFAVATAALIAIPVAVRTTAQETTTTLWDIGAHAMAFRTVTPDAATPDAEDAVSVVNGVPAKLFDDELVARLRTSAPIADTSSYLMLRLPLDGAGRTLTIGGFDVARPKAFSLTMVAPSQLVAGAFPRPADPGDLIVEREFAAAHGLAVGSTLAIGGRPRTVTGIVSPPLRPGKANAYMDIGRLRALARESVGLDLDGRVNAVLVESRGAQYHARALEEIRTALGADGQVASYGCFRPGVTVMALHRQVTTWLAVCLFVGMLALILRTQSGAVTERRRELAILRAVGWRTGLLTRQFVTAALLQSAAGGLLGVGLGIFLAWGGDCYLPCPTLPTGATLALAGQAFALTLAGGGIAGLAAVLAVVRLRPAAILRRP